MDSFALVDQLARDVPGLAPMLEDHIAGYDEVLPHVFFFSELTPFLIGLKDGSDADRAVLVKALSMLEEAWREGHEDVTNVIAVSFIENLQGRGELRAMQAFFGPAMSSWADRYWGGRLNPRWLLRKIFDPFAVVTTALSIMADVDGSPASSSSRLMTLPSLIGPLTGLHDGRLRSIRVSEGRASLGVTHVDGRRFRLELGGVEALCIDSFREDNIISELQVISGPDLAAIGVSAGDVLAALEVLFPRPHQLAAAEHHSDYDALRDRQLARLKAGEARLVLLEPAYGADLLAYCISAELVPDDKIAESEG